MVAVKPVVGEVKLEGEKLEGEKEEGEKEEKEDFQEPPPPPPVLVGEDNPDVCGEYI